jgi:hypothetical protein
MKINNYTTYLKKDWKNNKGRFVNNQKLPDEFVLPMDDIDQHLIKTSMKIQCVVNKEFENIQDYNYYNAELKSLLPNTE